MELDRHQSPKKFKPTTIFPAKVQITNRANYHQFLKRHPKILKEVEIEKSYTAGYGFPNYHRQNIPILLKIFKSIKYASKFDLRKLTFSNQAIYKPKIIYFAKRMSHSRAILIQDINKPHDDAFLGMTESWIKFAKRAYSCGYFPQFYTFGQNADRPLSWKFPHYLQHQPHLKDLSLAFDYFSMTYLQGLFLDKYPATLQRLSLQGLHFEKPIPTSFHRFKDLKHLDLQFYPKCRRLNNSLRSSDLPSHLQSLSLSWPSDFTSKLISTFPTMKNLKSLTQLKLSPLHGDSENPLIIFEYFHDCPIQDLALIVTIKSSKELDPLISLLNKLPHLESLKLKIHCRASLLDGPEVKEILQIIDNLAPLKNLFISLTDNLEKKKHDFPPMNSIFSKIFTKAIPLESFRIELKPINSTSQDFLDLIESLRPLTPTLKKLRIDIGEYRPNKDEFETVLSFIRSLESIRSLRLGTLSIPVKQFFIDLVRIVHQMPYLRTLAVGEVKGVIKKPKFMDIVEEILQKRGLKTFDCKVSEDFQKVLETRHKRSPEINLVEVRKKNPSLVKLPNIRIFVGDRKGEYPNWVLKD